MKVLVLLALSACWTNQPQPTVVIREVMRYRVIHDIPRECAGLPEFPKVAELGDRTHFVSPFVAQLDRWVQAAGACLSASTYHIDQIVQETQP